MSLSPQMYAWVLAGSILRFSRWAVTRPCASPCVFQFGDSGWERVVVYVKFGCFWARVASSSW